MIRLYQCTNLLGDVIDFEIASDLEKEIDAQGLLLMPAVVDPHVHFRTPGWEYKEDWQTGGRAALRGGVATVFDMPNTQPPTISKERLVAKKALIDQQLKSAELPLKYQLFFGADKQTLSEIERVAHECVGIKVFMGCSTGNLVIDDDESLSAVFKLAAEHNLLVAVHAEDEALIKERKAGFPQPLEYASHSAIRSEAVAVKAVQKALKLAEEYGTKLYILHVSTSDEITLIRHAKQKGLPVYAETTPHHLFLNTSVYPSLQGKALVNPPLREPTHQTALWQAIHDGVIDTIGSDHAPHTEAEKSAPYGECPSGMPGIEFMLPLLLNAHHQGLLSLQEIVRLTSERAQAIFDLPKNQDWILVNLAKAETVGHTLSKCQWTPYVGFSLTGWPLYTIVNGQIFKVN